MDTNYYREIGEYFDKDACEYDSRYWANPVVQQIRQSFREEVKYYPANSMLEIGFGTGMDLVHFARIHPHRQVYGIDLSSKMCNLASDKILQNGCSNIQTRLCSIEGIPGCFPGQQFDIIYVFFGALNTVENLNRAAQCLTEVLNPGGVLVLSFVNKWYLGGIFLELIRFRFSRSFARLKTTWRGYSSVHYLPSHCYTPGQVKAAFPGLKSIKKKGYTIVHPAWYFTGINRKLGRLRHILWKIDEALNKTFFWRFGEYALLVFKK